MLVVFSPIFVADKKLIFVYNFVAPLTEVAYDFNIVTLLSLCVNQFIQSFFPELFLLSLYCF